MHTTHLGTVGNMLFQFSPLDDTPGIPLPDVTRRAWVSPPDVISRVYPREGGYPRRAGIPEGWVT